MLACNALLALLWATLYAPLFHVHTHPGETPVIHAHFPEIEIAEDEGVVHMEREHSHADARSIDLLTTTGAPHTHLGTIAESTYVRLVATLPCCGFVALALPRAHGPPGIESRIPRAPPA